LNGQKKNRKRLGLLSGNDFRGLSTELASVHRILGVFCSGKKRKKKRKKK
jgi:hypothetical protein